jgi:hypothetical protein
MWYSVGMEQLLTHIFGDFVLQSDYLAMNKAKHSWPCFIHVCIYTSCFLMLTLSWKALLVIGVTHFLIDRFHTPLCRFIWFKNHMGPGLKYVQFEKCKWTGYYDNLNAEASGVAYTNENINGFTPRLNYVTLWLYIVTDNFLHLTINFLALKYLS